MHGAVKLMGLPLPLVLAVAYTAGAPASDQFPDEAVTMQGGPEWLVGAVAGVWVLLWLLDRIGKLPTAKVDRRRGPKFEESDRKAVSDTLAHVLQLSEVVRLEADKNQHLHDLLMYRSGEDGIERWLRHHQVTNEMHVVIHKLVQLLEETHAHRRDESRRTGVLVNTMEAIQKSLARMERRHEGLESKVDSIGRRGA